MRLNKLLIKFSVSFLGILFGLGVLEVFFHFYTVKDIWGLSRIAMGERLTDCQATDDKLNHKLLPNCQGTLQTKEYKINLITNSLGFRDEEIKNKTEETYRVLILGDSFAEGWGVDIKDRFDTVAEKKVAEAKGKRAVEIIDAGTRSYSPILELELLRINIDKIKPDLVISFFDLSDLHDDYYYGGWKRHFDLKKVLGFDSNSYIDVWPPEEPQFTRLLLKSKLFQVVYSEVGTEMLNGRKKLTRTNLSWDISLFAKAHDWENFDKAWNLSVANLMLIGDFLKTKNIDYAVAVVPRGNYIDLREWDSGRDALGIERQKLYEPKPIEIITRELTKRVVVTLDLVNPLRSSDMFPLFYPFDGHWTVKGHQIVGNELALFLTERVTDDD